MKKLQSVRLIVQLVFVLLSVKAFITLEDNLFLKIFTIAGLILGGTFYCGWLCPFGAVQDVFSKVGSLFIKKKYKMSPKIQKNAIYLRYVLTALFFIALALNLFNFDQYDSRTVFVQILSLNGVAISAIILMSVFILIALFFDRPFCNYFCSQGAELGIVSLLRIITIKRDPKTCVNCKKCDRSCPMNINISEKKSLRSAQCINCFQCMSNCPVSGTLKYSITRFGKNSKVENELEVWRVKCEINKSWLYSRIATIRPWQKLGFLIVQ